MNEQHLRKILANEIATNEEIRSRFLDDIRNGEAPIEDVQAYEYHSGAAHAYQHILDLLNDVPVEE